MVVNFKMPGGMPELVSHFKYIWLIIMKRKHKRFAQLFLAGIMSSMVIYLASCDKETDKPTGKNIVLTSTTAGSPGYFTVEVSSSLSQTGGQTITNHGFCYATTPNPDLKASVKSLGNRTEPGDFSAELTNLNDNKKYYIRAFATFSGGTIYAEPKEITTLKTGKPRIRTTVLSEITPISAVCGGKIESDSGYAVTTSGICWDTDNQFNENQCMGKVINTSSDSLYSLNITGLTEGTTYYVKAFATNQKGTGYGEIREFSSVPATIPSVTTNAITNPTSNSATGGGNVTSDGNANVTDRGVCWNTTDNPSLQNCLGFTTNGQGEGSFTSNIQGLSDGVVYYVKAYATNTKGTAYGNQVSFSTEATGFVCGNTLTINHVAGEVSPVNKTVNYGTVETDLTGSNKCWITQNLGSDRQALSATDDTEASAGWYWQFNRKQGYKHDGTNRTPNTTWISYIDEDSDWLPANDPCTLLLGSGWRLPTKTEWQTADSTGGWFDLYETFASVLKLHAAGCLLSGAGVLSSRGSYGFYWSSSQGGSDDGWYLSFGSGYSGMYYLSKSYGFSARCLRN